MKRFFAVLLCFTMVCAMVACNNSTPNNENNNNGGTNDDNHSTNATNDKAYRMGLGLTVESTVSPAENDDNGNGSAKAAVTTCALLLDNEGKIISVSFDCIEASANYKTGGDVTWENNIKSKRELGSNYGVKKYSSIGKEWYEQVDALEDYCIGKTVSDVSSMQMKEVDGRQGVPAAAELSSSCTISCTQFIAALKKAEKNVM